MSEETCWTVERLLEKSVDRLADLVFEDRVPPIDGQLPAGISNAVFHSLKKRGKMCSASLKRLEKTSFCLTECDLSSCECDGESIRILSTHPLTALSLFRCSTSKCDPRSEFSFVMAPDAPCRQTLRSLNIGGSASLFFSYLPTVTSFACLDALFLADIPSMSNSDLSAICNFLVNLRVLDISNDSNITDISSLSSIKKLQVALLHGLRLDMDTSLIATTFCCLSEMRVIDLSDRRNDFLVDSNDERARLDLAFVFLDTLKHKNEPFWPELRSIDLAGNPLTGMTVEEAKEAVDLVVARHPHIQSLSLLDTPIDGVAFMFKGRPLVHIANGSTRPHALHALSLYWMPDRSAFTAHALQAVYYLLQSSYDSFLQEEILKCAELVELSMRHHPLNLPIQMAGSACLYHLCKLKRIRRLGAMHVRRCVERCLDAAQAYPSMTQLQKNVWLTICNDHLLQNSHIDFYRTCSVALESMLNNSDPSISRMTIAIVSIAAPKVSSSESNLLASDDRYIGFLIEIIRQHLDDMAGQRDNFSQFTLKFTLSALWNLTDECAATCAQFVRKGGVEVVFRILFECPPNENIRTKVLGLLNNVAEVWALQRALLVDEYLLLLISILTTTPVSDENGFVRIDSQYFSAGILSNLIANVHLVWECCPSPDLINDTLLTVVGGWPRMESAMVAYRSFSPFLPLLSHSVRRGAQMWAVWAVQHVCVGRSLEREYPRRLREQGGTRLLHSIHQDQCAPSKTRLMAREVLVHCGEFIKSF